MSYQKLLVAALLLPGLAASAQKTKTYKFEKITPAALSVKSYDVDSSAEAVVLADVGETVIEGNAKGWFSFTFRRHKRVHILKKDGYDEATFQIPLYHDGQNEEQIDHIRAYAYNLENGQVKETKLSKESIFKEKVNKNRDLYKFTLPSVREGTIIDVEYKITSDYLYTLQPWDFQSRVPVLWSEYNLGVPQFFDYMFIYKGYVPFAINDKQDRTEQFNIIDRNTVGASERYSLTSGVTQYRYVTQDVPAFRSESYLSSRANYQAHMELQLAAYRYPLTYHNFVPTWPEMTQQLLKDESFGQKLDRNNPWLNETMRPLETGSALQKAQAIYGWVRDNISCSGQRGIYLQNAVKDVFRSGKGSVAEVNLLLVTMLRHAGLDANAVMLSTRDNGTVYTSFPMLSRFNYIIASVQVEGNTVLLDASTPRLGFGRLLPECFNGTARTIDAAATEMHLLSDSLQEKKMTLVFLPQKGKAWEGTFSQVPGYYESHSIRSKAKEKGADALFAELRSGLGSGVTLTHTGVDSLNQYSQPVALHADMKLPVGDEDILYVNPMFGQGLGANPFKSPERSYPVEMPYTIDESFYLTLHVPDGYVVDELPKSIRLALNERNEGSFEYLISESEGVISLRSQIRIKRANFLPEDYESLREFFNMVVTKHKEQIVFKKKK
ncbi:MAG: DUF3857 domain-containing protein [Chitinophagaceae bacterium]|nr:MAG: DUF3857 domain-containing protein [Chitinophagaceae bacterium]